MWSWLYNTNVKSVWISNYNHKIIITLIKIFFLMLAPEYYSIMYHYHTRAKCLTYIGMMWNNILSSFFNVHTTWSRTIWMIKSTWLGHVAHMAELTNAHRILVGKCEGRRSFDNIKVYIKEISFEHMDWINLAYDMIQW